MRIRLPGPNIAVLQFWVEAGPAASTMTLWWGCLTVQLWAGDSWQGSQSCKTQGPWASKASKKFPRRVDKWLSIHLWVKYMYWGGGAHTTYTYFFLKVSISKSARKSGPLRQKLRGGKNPEAGDCYNFYPGAFAEPGKPKLWFFSKPQKAQGISPVPSQDEKSKESLL